MLKWSFQNTWTFEKVIHKAAFYKNVTQEVGNYHLKHLPVIAKPPSLLRVCSWALQGRGVAGTKVLTTLWSSAPPDSPSLHRWSYLEPVDLEHLLWTIPLLHTFTVRSAATPKPSSLSFPLWFITFFFFFFAGTQLFIFSAKINIFISWKYLILLKLCHEEKSMLLFFTILCLIGREWLLYIIFSLLRRSFHLFITACGSLIISIALLMFSKSFE